jgi:hypothetical protein
MKTHAEVEVYSLQKLAEMRLSNKDVYTISLVTPRGVNQILHGLSASQSGLLSNTSYVASSFRAQYPLLSEWHAILSLID